MLQKELFCLSEESVSMLCWVLRESSLSLEKITRRNKLSTFFTLTQKRFLKFSNNTYQLTIHGYDAIALHDLKRKGLLMLGDRIGTGKEADIHYGKLRIKTLEPVDLSKEKYNLKGELNPNYPVQSESTIYQPCFTDRITQLDYEEDLLDREIVNGEVLVDYENKIEKQELPKSIFDIQNGTELFSESYKKGIKINFDRFNFQCYEKVVDVIIKFHRLGRTSFRNVKNLRDYQPDKDNWFSLSEKSAELESLNLLTLKNLQVPRFYLQYRHLVVMEYLYGYQPLNSVINIDKDKVYNEMCNFLFELYKMGFVHGDFNEFNVMVNNACDIKVIDFPQVITTTHINAKEYLTRDYKCVNEYFFKKYKYVNRCLEVEQAIERLSRNGELFGIDQN